MEVKYRIVEEITPDGSWETAGVIALWPDEQRHLQLRTMLQHTVSRAIWGEIRQRVKKDPLTLDTYHKALKGYEQNYRLQTDVHTIKVSTPEEARHQIREKYIFVQPNLAETAVGI